MPSLVCVPITVRTPEGAVAEAIGAAEHGADLVELRVDGFFNGEDPEGFAATISSLVGRSPLPCIVTCRSHSEGGEYEGDDESLAMLYARIATAPDPDQVPRYLDVEHARFVRSALYRKSVRDIVAGAAAAGHGKPSIILSFHDFSGRPADLFRKLTAMREHPEAAILKVAFKARSLRDATEALHLPASSDRPMISLAMGEFGLMSRVLAPKFGGMLTFASLRPASVTAPGQPTIGDLLRLFRFRSITPKTALYGVVGWPVSHSRSPLIHNTAFARVGHEGVYLPLPVAAGETEDDSYASLKASLLELLGDEQLRFRGCSVTIPHKVGLLRLATEQGWAVDPLARAAGAANTLVVSGDGIRVFNSDVSAILSCLAKHAAPRTAVVLGAGGAARAAVAALRSLHAAVFVVARDSAKAAAMAGPSEVVLPWGASLPAATELVINCTPIGMEGGPAPGESPLAAEQLAALHKGAVVFDTVYTPAETPLLVAAKAAGLRVIQGTEMFRAQAAEQFFAWTGKTLPSDDAAPT